MQFPLKRVAVSLVVGAVLSGLLFAKPTLATAPTVIVQPEPPQEARKPVLPAILHPIGGCEGWHDPSKEGTQWMDAESRPTTTNTGIVLIGITGDIGKYQVNPIHIPEAQKLGFDIYTEAGNTAYALVLYKRNGTRDWSSSEHCWAR